MTSVTVNNAGTKSLLKAIKDIQSKVLKVGFFDTAKYEDGTPIAYVAAIQEFGYPGGSIPARPFFRPTIAAEKNAWRESLRKGFKATIAGRFTVEQVLGQVGQLAAGQVQETISSIYNPPLAQSTVNARKSRSASGNASSKPLVDTGALIAAVSSQVESK